MADVADGTGPAGPDPAPGTSPRARVALVLVSHSAAIAEGTAALAGQMAPGVLVRPVGGTPDGGLGTDFDRTLATVEGLSGDVDGVVVLADLGSAVLTVESVLDFLDDDVAARTRLVDAPFVEGAVAAAVTAHGGGAVADVVAAAEHAGSTFAGSSGTVGEGPTDVSPQEVDVTMTPTSVPATAQQVEVRNPLGLHARPAAVLARMVAGFDAAVTIGGVNAASVLELMKLGAVKGQVVDVTGAGPQAAEAVAAVVTAIEGGFGEV